MCRAAPTPASIPKRTLVQLYAACVVELAVVAFLALYEPPKAYNKCATAFFALGTTTIDLVLLAFIRCATYIVIAHRTPPSTEAADAWAERLSHVSLIQLTYGIAKGVSRALGARAACRSNTIIFDGCCAAFAVFASIGPAFLERRLRTKAKRTDLTEPLLGEEAASDPPRKTASTIRAIAAIARPDAHLFWLAMVFAVLAALATSAVSLWTGDALDALIAHDDGAKFKKLILQLMLISVAGAACTGCRGGIFSWIGVRINVRIRDKLFRHLVGLELGYYDVTPTGDLNSRLASDTSKVGDQVSLNVNVFARTAVQLATTLAFMVHASPPLSLVACCAVPVIGVATKRYGKLVWGLSKKMQNELAGAMRVAEEAFSSMLTVRSMAAEPLVCADFGEALQKYARVGRLQALLYACWQSFNTALPNLMTCLLLFYGGHVVDKGELRSGRLVSFMLLTQSLSDSFNTLADMYSNIADALGAADKVFELLERKPVADAPPAPLNMDDDDDAPCRGDVSFEDVSFCVEINQWRRAPEI
jgi:ABC-type bacteriocin/lantibiotic exporter with double-glycine peptidase domain